MAVTSPKLQQPKMFSDIGNCPLGGKDLPVERHCVRYSSFRFSYHVAYSDSPQNSSSYFFHLEALWRIDWRGSLLKGKGQVDGTVVMLLRKSEDYGNYCSWYLSVWGHEGGKGVTVIPRILKQVNDAICRQYLGKGQWGNLGIKHEISLGELTYIINNKNLGVKHEISQWELPYIINNKKSE